MKLKPENKNVYTYIYRIDALAHTVVHIIQVAAHRQLSCRCLAPQLEGIYVHKVALCHTVQLGANC